MFSSNTASSRARKGINSFGVDSKRQQNMVKLPTGKITEEEARSLFECYVGGCVKNENEFGQDLAQAQSNSICCLISWTPRLLEPRFRWSQIPSRRRWFHFKERGHYAWKCGGNRRVCLHVDPWLTRAQALGMAVQRSLDWFGVKSTENGSISLVWWKSAKPRFLFVEFLYFLMHGSHELNVSSLQ